MNLFKKKKKEKYIPKVGIMGEGIDYNYYEFSKIEQIGYYILGAVVSAIVAYIFYESIIMSIIAGVIAGFIYLPIRKNQIIEKRKNKLLIQFKDMLESLNTSIGAGLNIMDSFSNAATDMAAQFNEDSYICKELKIINAGIYNNINVEELLLDLGERSGIADIVSFANVFDTCYRKGGNIKEVIKNTYTIICDKIDIQLEIKTMVSGKKGEQTAMMVMPVVFVFLLKSLGTEVIDLTSAIGRVTTTVAIVIFVISYFIGKKILDIKL